MSVQQIKLRRGDAAEWTSVNPVLGYGEPGFERDTNKIKLGDGVSAWNDLDYLTSGLESAINDALALKADTATTVNGQSLSSNVTITADDIGSSASGNISATTVQTALEELDSDKADKSDTYTKTEVDTSLTDKADKSDTYTKTEVDTSLTGKADKSDTYTKTEVDTSLSGKADKTTTVNTKPLSTNISLSATDIPNTPAGGIAATTVQAAINELDTEKASQAHLTEKTSYGVISGLVTSAQATPDMTVKVSAGVLYMANGDRFAPSAVSSIAVTAANATNPRIDIIYVSSTGVVSYLAGTAAATPAQPTVPTGGQLLATINVSANATSITTSNVTLLRNIIGNNVWYSATLVNGATGYLNYKMSSDGQVFIDGVVTPGNPNVIAILPQTFYPPKTIRTPISQSAASTVTFLVILGSQVYLTSGSPACDVRCTYYVR